MKAINIAQEFTTVPGPRYRRQGPHSGEEFRERLLEPKFDEAQAVGETLTIELDGAEFGYPTSFLEEAFGGLARIKGIEKVQAGLVFVATEEPLLEEEIRRYIVECNDIKPALKRD